MEVPLPDSIKDESNLSINGNAAEENHAAAPARMSWASLFNKGKDSNESNGDVVGVTTMKPLAVVAPFVPHSMSNRSTAVAIENLKEPLRSNADDPVLHRLGGKYNLEFLYYFGRKLPAMDSLTYLSSYQVLKKWYQT